jgi:4-carboxymuconolactone decarboxylase
MPISYLKGLEQIEGIDPESGLLFVEELKKVSPDFAEYFVGFAFGKIHARRILDAKTKELVAIASLIALGDGKSHLQLRILGATRVGCTREEIIEVVIQSVVYAGFTRAMAAMNLVREVFADDANIARDNPPDSPASLSTAEENANPNRKKPASRAKPGQTM